MGSIHGGLLGSTVTETPGLIRRARVASFDPVISAFGIEVFFGQLLTAEHPDRILLTVFIQDCSLFALRVGGGIGGFGIRVSGLDRNKAELQFTIPTNITNPTGSLGLGDYCTVYLMGGLPPIPPLLSDRSIIAFGLGPQPVFPENTVLLDSLDVHLDGNFYSSLHSENFDIAFRQLRFWDNL